MSNEVKQSAAAARREVREYEREAEKVEARARDLRALANTAGPGPESDNWMKQAAFLDQVAGAHRRRAAQATRYLAHPMFENVGPDPTEAA
jgi:hypothetical protein